jgi:hypothetical protein
MRAESRTYIIYKKIGGMEYYENFESGQDKKSHAEPGANPK